MSSSEGGNIVAKQNKNKKPNKKPRGKHVPGKFRKAKTRI